MTKKHKTIIAGTLLLVLLLLAVYIFKNNYQKENGASFRIATPTLFVHGWGSSYHAEESMVAYAQKSHATNSVIRADVSSKGKVTLLGTIKKRAKNPIVEVNLQNNKSIFAGLSNQTSAMNKSSNYIKDVINALQKRYRFNRINLVGHSMGNLQIAYYLRNNATNAHMPQLNKQVSIAGHYNGYVGEQGAPNKTVLNRAGKPQKMSAGYRGLISLRKKFPQKAAVLNIYGDMGSGSDGDVTVNSARSYRYLVSKRARSYQEKEIRGPRAQHSKLHENTQVDRLLVNFLW
ncbi:MULTISPECIES: alpha/beta hydrolase [unclassified Lactobacillus]|uniref:alpha/beta hydrolase n=1 Tax=unclassified Lactobacillus TaxID=2620435 RepID=UPI0018DB1901|nr:MULTISPECIES: alpha/beta hydrolase [unclassified Lactobacillus]MBH9990348.1 alpha/beta hydrolase [Lactobacillus sp. M0392]MBI0023148.1 alpha/beta hydrolase [Lactobacillus sp. W8171]MBI0045359.1 alpha/beta hydrolase [Lactobacillus sp. M0393]